MPVDAVALGLHDYHLIVKRPMDLGTVKANLAKNFYPTPIEFAADMRLTFNNALLYNPKSDPVNGMAEQMLARFEELFRPIQEKINKFPGQRREREFRDSRANEDSQFRGLDELQGSSWNNHNDRNAASPLRAKKAKPKASPVPSPQVFKKPDRMVTPMPAHSSASTPSHPPPPSMNQQPLLPEELPPSPVRAPALSSKEQKAGRGGAVKLPKPRAKDPNKREMSMEEKQKLGIGTLWELDRFVTNWKKMVSKTKRQALLMNINPAGGVATSSWLMRYDSDSGSSSGSDSDADDAQS
ncbi:UNVERIFIED_CONTAM: Transcription factor GTE7 [Sesamum radiatum]|uniref:Transcription factor GTE7 n=1 Tax=Sesamum radiatum TaxID=300843 RepID=A0AAW2RWV5_SESRA